MKTVDENLRVPEIEILERTLLNGRGRIRPDLARYILDLRMDDKDLQRARELADRNQDGKLSRREHSELIGFARAGCLLGAMQARARHALQVSARRKKPR